ncbi:MAG: glycosyltransferase [Hyphomicrobium sp.]|nr:glycosyltransferase [Hyphomicrobium sp.]MBN9266340.1 glycosyltransferase [Hyphomicrobium sp.]MBN9279169.1 glycosyltransferase [Hyphomicrobium sp.]OJU28578.1 MAG: ceramide glucosyltransferase [Alphaproteobacteria bacterium 64-6]
MPTTVSAALAFVLVATTVHLFSIGVAMWRCHRSKSPTSGGRPAVGIALVRTIRDLGAHEEETLRSSFNLTHPHHEVIFCAASDSDPAVATVRKLIAEYPHVQARLLIGDDRISANPKLNNMLKGWQDAKYDWIVFADSNLMLPPDYLEQVLTAWTSDTGAVCAPPIGSAPAGFWAEVECAFLNTYQARWQYAADSLGLGFAQGKTMLFRRDVLENQGGIAALGSELAEDAATTKIVRNAGLRIRLAGPSFFQPLGQRSAGNVFARQLRWAQLRRLTFPGWFALELLTGSAAPLLAMIVAAPAFGLPPVIAVAALAALWFGGEALLARTGGWHLSWRAPVSWLLRDLLIPVIWLRAWTAHGYQWGGHKVAWQPGGSASMTTESAVGIR